MFIFAKETSILIMFHRNRIAPGEVSEVGRAKSLRSWEATATSNRTPSEGFGEDYLMSAAPSGKQKTVSLPSFRDSNPQPLPPHLDFPFIPVLPLRALSDWRLLCRAEIIDTLWTQWMFQPVLPQVPTPLIASDTLWNPSSGSDLAEFYPLQFHNIKIP